MGQNLKTIEIIEREPYPDVEYQSRRAYVYAVKPDNQIKQLELIEQIIQSPTFE